MTAAAPMRIGTVDVYPASNEIDAGAGRQRVPPRLMALLVRRGERAEAAALAESVETAPEDQFDPWWMYWLGGLRRYPADLAALRELAR